MRHQGREVALMALYALDGVPSFERHDVLRCVWTIFDYRATWEAIFAETTEETHPLHTPPMWKLGQDLPLTPAKSSAIHLPKPYPAAFNFAETRVQGVLTHLDTIDPAINDASRSWRINRMSHVDRNILRLGAYEILFCKDVPDPVAINESILLCKQYADLQAPKFINGVLDRIRRNKRHGSAPAVVFKR